MLLEFTFTKMIFFLQRRHSCSRKTKFKWICIASILDNS